MRAMQEGGQAHKSAGAKFDNTAKPQVHQSMQAHVDSQLQHILPWQGCAGASSVRGCITWAPFAVPGETTLMP